MAKVFIIFNVFCAILFCKVNAYSKRWIWSTSWNDPKNWDKQRLPCSQDAIQLSEGVIYVSKNSTIRSLGLPKNGELVLGDKTELTIQDAGSSSGGDKNCPKGESVTFIGTRAREWFNPLNWNFMEGNKVAPWSNGTLFMDRIPCVNDQVYFPEGDSFKVSLKKKAEVAEIFLSQKSVGDMSAYLSSRAGQLRFKLSSGSSLTVNKKLCSQPFGCPCGYAKMKSAICSSFECPPTCENKVKPEGDCCERCGALVKIKLNRNFNLAACQKNMQNNLVKAGQSGVTLVVSPIVDDNAIERAQILLTDSSNGEGASGAADTTISYLRSGKDSDCSVFDVKRETGSGDGKTGKSTGSTESSSTVALAVTLTLALLLIALAAAYLFYRKKRGSLVFRKQVLHNEMDISGSHTVELVDTQFSGAVMDYGIDLIDVPGKGGASFENPMYDEAMPSGPAVIKAKTDLPDLEPINAKPLKKEKKDKKSRLFSKGKSKSEKNEGRDAFENPAYAEFTQDMDDSFDQDSSYVVSDDNGFSNPIYGDVYPTGSSKDVEEVQAKLPPSFLDEIGFTPEDMDDAINAVNQVSPGGENLSGVMIDDFDLQFGFGDKGESEA